MGHHLGGPMPRDPMELFASKTRRMSNGCIEWTAGLDSTGYGKFATGTHGNQKHHRAHRWIYERLKGPIGDLVLRHKCDNPKCVNVDHLEPGTQLQNIHDARDRGRMHGVLTPDLVRHLRSVRASGSSLRAEALRLGIKYMTAVNAVNGSNWRHIK